MGICSSASLSASRLVSLLNAYNNQDQSILDEILASFPISSLGHRLLDFTCCRNHGMFDACDALWLRIFGSEQPRRGQFQSASSWQRKQTASGWNPCRMGSLVSVVTLPYIYIFHLQIVVLGNYSIVSQVSSTCLFRAVPMRRSFTLSVQRCTSVSWLLRRMSPPLSPVHVADASDDLPDEAVESPMAPCMQTLWENCLGYNSFLSKPSLQGDTCSKEPPWFVVGLFFPDHSGQCVRRFPITATTTFLTKGWNPKWLLVCKH